MRTIGALTLFLMACSGSPDPLLFGSRSPGDPRYADAGPTGHAGAYSGGRPSSGGETLISPPDGNSAGGAVVATGGAPAGGGTTGGDAGVVAQLPDAGPGGSTSTGGAPQSGGAAQLPDAGTGGSLNCPRTCTYPRHSIVGCVEPVCGTPVCDSACDAYTSFVTTGDGHGGIIVDIVCSGPCIRIGDCCA